MSSSATGPDLRRLRDEVAAGRLSRHGLFEEVERHLERAPDTLPEGALDLVLEELHKSPREPHLLRLLAKLMERDGDARGAQRTLLLARPSTDAEAPDDELTDSLDDRLLVARVLLEADEIDDADAHAEAALNAEPNSLSALNLLAKISHLRGRLTKTLELWQRLRLLAPVREAALEQLGILHRFGEDEELSRSGFVPIGENTFAKKHPAQRELELAFARFKERDFPGALAICDELASKNRAKVPALYKLAVLQRAWFQERTDDLNAARETLEALGRERGFETDVDRLAFLARLCERIDSPAARRQAVHIYEHLNLHHGKLSALGRLSALQHSLGEHEKADASAREFERRFTRRMHRPTVQDLVRGLALFYVPLQRFHSHSPSDEEREATLRELRLARSVGARRRRRALLAFFDGDRPRALRLLTRLLASRVATPKDFAYCADFLFAGGEVAGAFERYLEAARRGLSGSRLLLSRLLATATTPEAREALGKFFSGESGLRAREVLLAGARRRHADPKAWNELSQLEAIIGRDAEAAAHGAKATALAAAPAPPAGLILVAAVYQLQGKPKGLVHELAVVRRAARPALAGSMAAESVVGNVTPDLRSLAVQTVSRCLDYVRAHWPHLAREAAEFEYVLQVAKDDEPSSGNSAGLPLALATLAAMLARPIPSGWAFTGAVVCDAASELTVRRIGDSTTKVKAAYHRNLSHIMLPAENREDVERAGGIPPSLARELVVYVSTLDEAVQALWGAEAWDW